MARSRLPATAFRLLAFVSVLGLSAIAGARAQETVTDLAGRQVEIPQGVDRIILGEGRLIYVIATLDREDPFARIVGWADDLRTTDYSVYEQYAAKFPAMTDIPIVGNPTSGEFSVESAITSQPDVIFMTERNAQMTAGGGLVDQLTAAGIAVVFVDFRDDISGATVPSLRLMGKVLGREAQAEEVVAFYEEQMAEVTGRLIGSEPRPDVFIERTAGLRDVECCRSFGSNNMGWLIDTAGGHNIAGDLIPGATGTINPEEMVASSPDVYIASGSNWTQLDPEARAVSLGNGADVGAAREKLAGLIERPVIAQTAAVQNGRVHAIWHQFYTSPYHFAAVQAFAKWFHPELFADLDPDANFREFHEQFLPIEYQGGYWVSLED